MTKRLALFLVALQFHFTAKAKYEQERDNFFLALKNLNHQVASDLARQIPDNALGEAMVQLSMLLHNAGQVVITPSDTVKYQLLNRSFPQGHYGRIITKLLLGYSYFFTDPYTEKPIKNFSEAYLLANDVGTNEEIKYALYSIIKMYNWELSQSNDDLIDYLSLYEKYVSDSADRYHFLMNKFKFELRNIFLNVDLNDQFFTSMSLLMPSFSKDHHFWTEYYITLGIYKKYIKKYEEAIDLHTMALKRIGDEPYLRYLKFSSYIQLAEIARYQGEYEEAILFIDSARKSSYVNDPVRAEYYLNYYLAPNLFGLGDANEAYFTLSRSDTFKNQLDYDRNSLSIAQYKWKFQTEETKAALIIETAQREIAEKRNLYILVIAILFILFISTVYYLIQKNTNRKQQLAVQEKNIEKQKVATLLKEQELATIDAMIIGQEKERQRIANDLHDDLGSLMASIKLHFDSIKTNSTKGLTELHSKTDALIDEAYNKIRAIAHAKNSGMVAKEGLLKSVKEMANKVSVANNLTLTVSDHGLDKRMENSLELTLFRIIQELITNVVKHADASEANIHLTRHSDCLNIMIEDNGGGFDTSVVVKTDKGMGLRSIDKRISHLGGTVNIDSEIGKGTTIIIEVPI
ncbi:MAG: sensor histidine kinase [Cyclobacteriaceae bacterium]